MSVESEEWRVEMNGALRAIQIRRRKPTPYLHSPLSTLHSESRFT